ncbi:Mpp10 protein [Patellaria atrata CBS 101060]|uniref:U3 small nucleolar ribonucleoprotein protein MPP10 n=1 Tax=Patellaria atrata CBS 101060 TaxID=1346257 RepID=A0A9P4SFB5_9PEZI|nr:Mpp10 protein [Patellaria atrata CBS 101060]
MTTLSFSPTGSISSHTLSAQSFHPPPMDLHPSSTQALLATLQRSPHSFLQPTSSLHSASIVLAKRYLDPLASGISEVQSNRLKNLRKKRKRGDNETNTRVLRLKQIHTEGFGVDQVWEQARKVLDAAREEVEQALPEGENAHHQTNGDSDSLDDQGTNGPVKMVRFDDGFEVDDSDEEEDNLSGEDVSGFSEEDSISGSDHLEDTDMKEGDDIEEGDEEELEGNEDMDINGILEDGADPSVEIKSSETFVPDPHGLNDGFFSIDDFNKQSEFLTQQDERGDPDDGRASDEEDIDFDADPLAANQSSKFRPGPSADYEDEEEDDDDDDDEEGPTFGDVDLNAPEGASDMDLSEDEDMLDTNGITNTNNVMYADFFEPPPQKARKNKRGRPNPHNFPVKDLEQEKPQTHPNDEETMQRTIDSVHRDLFSESEHSDSDDALSDRDPADPKSRRSNHERRQAKLAEEIRRLEAANVAKREWVLAGEARAVDRPINSLLEEDLEFERAGKPVPVITAEVSEDIEELIKRRIVARQFDEVIRRRPDNLATGPKARRGLFELDDTKAKKGLAEEYEDEHLRATDPNFVDVKDEKLKAEHREIEKLWKEVSAKLDSLSSWHYRPKTVTPSLEIRTDAPTIMIEDARPTIGGEVGNASMLAPQELYKPGTEKVNGEVVTKGGMPIAREELSREEKLRRRRREKQRVKKAGGLQGKPVSKKVEERINIIGDLKKGGVKVIGKKGEIRDIEGKMAKHGPKSVGSGFKL